MKKIVFLALVVSLLSCSTSNTVSKNAQYFGEKITKKGAISSTKLAKKLENEDEVTVTLTAEINSVCKIKGCWMTMPMGNDTDLRVRFKDYAFFVPLDAAGKTATMKGVAKKEIISVADLKHYAEDNGDSQEDINAITEPKVEYSFLADGVIIE